MTKKEVIIGIIIGVLVSLSWKYIESKVHEKEMKKLNEQIDSLRFEAIIHRLDLIDEKLNK